MTGNHSELCLLFIYLIDNKINAKLKRTVIREGGKN